MESLRKSFKSHGPYQRSSSSCNSPSRASHSRKTSVDRDRQQEEQPILFDHYRDHAEVVVNVDDAAPAAPGGANYGSSNGNKVWRESSYEFWKEDSGGGGGGSGFSFPNQQHLKSVVEIGEDPPSKLISSFLNKQRAAGGEMALDLDFEMEDLKRCPPTTASNATATAAATATANPSSTSASKELRVSFQDPAHHSHSSSDEDEDEDEDEESSTIKRRLRVSTESPGASSRDGRGAEVLRCTSNASFRHTSTLLRAKTRSRLMDPPPVSATAPRTMEDDRRSGRIPRSGQLKSGILKSLNDDDDDDPFFEDDIPEDFKRSNFFSPLTILQWLSFILIVAALACSLAIPSWQRQTLWNLHLWKWEVMVLVLICGRLVSGWGIKIAVFFIERNFLLRKRVLYFVYALRKAVQNCLWLGLVLLAWHYLFDKKVERETRSNTLPYVTKVLFCLLLATLCRLVKTLLVKVLASSFHVSTYFDRIQESLFNQYVIELLSGPPLVEIKQTQEEEDRMLAEVQKLQNAGATIPSDLRAAALPSRSGRVIGSGGQGGSGHGGMQRSSQVAKSVRFSGGSSKKDFSKQQEDGITIDHLHKLNQKNISAWNMKRLMKIVRYGTLSTLEEQITHAGVEDESAMQIRSEQEAKIAARKIFKNVAKPGAKYIYLVDLMRFMREDEALKTMSLFEGAQEMKRVSRRSLKNWVVNAFRERRALSLTLNDTKTAVNKLHQMTNIVVGIIVLGLWLLILGIATTHFFVFLSSQVLVAVFMFGNTLKTTFEAIIFLFVMHPFDVGDRCEVDGVQMIVEEMNIMTTVFLRFDNQKIMYPNSVLSTKPISNLYRSPDMGDSIDFCVHVSTPVEKLAVMKERIKAFIESKKEHWHPGPSVVLKDLEDFHKLNISVWLQHRINFQDMGQRWARRELVVCEMIKVLRELDIDYRMLPLDVNVRDMPALSSSRLPSTWTTCS